MTIREALAKGTMTLKAPTAAALIYTPELDANLLLAQALNTNHEDLIVRGNETINEEA